MPITNTMFHDEYDEYEKYDEYDENEAMVSGCARDIDYSEVSYL